MTNPQLRALKNSAQFLLFAHLFWDKFYSVGDTVGASMLPTFNVSHDWILISKLHTLGRGCQVGDIVSYAHPVYGPKVSVIKRIIGMPGDFVLKDPTDGSNDMLQVGALSYEVQKLCLRDVDFESVMYGGVGAARTYMDNGR